MLYDSHIHIVGGLPAKEAFAQQLTEAGVDGGILFSYPPDSFSGAFQTFIGRDRLADLMEWASNKSVAAAGKKLYPFYWIDPLEEDAAGQIDRAVEAGVAGFKCICSYFNPGDDCAMRIWERIAQYGKPLKFHSGILYSGGASSQYNRPMLFEPLFDIPHLRFSISHVSWPWCDECLAVYGKWKSNQACGLTTAELYIDTTPGTPAIYREEVLYKIYHIGYDIENNVTFGTDLRSDYNIEAAKRMIQHDKEILDRLGVSQQTQEKYFADNTVRFVEGR